MTNDLSVIVNRLERLERQRFWVIGIGTLFLIALGLNVFLWYQSQTPRVWPEIKTKKMVLVGGGKSKERGELFLRGSDPVFVLQSPYGSRAVLGADGLELYDPEGNRMVWLHLNQGEPALALSEKSNLIGVALAMHGVYVWDHKGHFRASLACKEDDVALMLLDTKENTRLFIINTQATDETKMHILNNKEKSVWSAP